jgi:mono/diheme cytochrome c family protein/cytochrome c551/c552
MTNRAQAKPTKDPKDPIQQQSLLGPAFLAAGAVFLTVLWMLWDDFIYTKPWKAYQDTYKSVAASFLAEQMYNERLAAEKAGAGNTDAAVADVATLRGEAFTKKIAEIDADIKMLEKQIEAVEGVVGDTFWKKEQSSMATAQRYAIEHHVDKNYDSYLANLEEVNRRTNIVVAMKLYVERLRGRIPDLGAAIISIEAKLRSTTAAVRIVQQSFTAVTEMKKDYVQVYKNHGGSGDIVDRCESCHRGTNEVALERDKMWASHLSNDAVRGFVVKWNGKNYYEYKGRRVAELKRAEDALVAAGKPVQSFFVADAPLPEDLNKITEGKREWMVLQNVSDIGGLLSRALLKPENRADFEALLVAWNAGQMWRGNSMLAPVTEDPEGPEFTHPTPVISAAAKDYKIYSASYDKSLDDNKDAEKKVVGLGALRDRETLIVDRDLPDNFLTAEALIWLSVNGPYRFDGHMTYPDRFGIGMKSWFLAVVNDPRVQELYKYAYNDFRSHVKENLLMFTAHPRRDALIATHPRDTFGCMTCHRGFGINAKSVRTAHGQQVHWLVPMFKEGYAEAGCQKCHKADIELAGATRIQEGKTLYFELGCWGCHAYQGYELEAGDKLKAAKDGRDATDALVKVNAELERMRAEYKDHAEGVTIDRLKASGMSEDAANNESARLTNIVQDKIWAKEREQIAITAKLRQSAFRSDELDREHKKRGPTLKDTYVKVGDDNKGWVADWIRYPKNFRPSTRMPHFFYGPFAFLDELKLEEAGGNPEDAFDSKENAGNPLHRRYNKQTVEAMKKIIAYIWQSSRAANQLGDAPTPSSHGVAVGDAQAINDGRLLFSSTGCMGCHSTQPDLVRGSVSIPISTFDGENKKVHGRRDFTTEYKLTDEWIPAPKYEYRLDGQLSRDGHDNIQRNEFIYSFAANLSRVGEKATADYLVEWVLQPRVRNKHSVMPSFFAAIAGTPDGDERRKLDASIASLTGKTDIDSKLQLADERRRRGDITPDALALYRGVVKDAAIRARTDTPSVDARVRLEKALEGYEKAKLIAAYLKSLVNPELAKSGWTSAQAGYIGDYDYMDSIWVADNDASVIESEKSGKWPNEPKKTAKTAAEEDEKTAPVVEREMPATPGEARNKLGLLQKPKGSFQNTKIEVKGFGDFSFMNDGYDQFLAARTSQRAALALEPLALAVRNAGVTAAAAPTAPNLGALTKAVADFERRYNGLRGPLTALAGFAEDPEGTLVLPKDASSLDRLTTEALKKSLLALEAEIGGLDAVLRPSFGGGVTADSAKRIANDFASAAATFKNLREISGDYEATTKAGSGKRFTAFYGCAGCHEIEGMEAEGKIGTELTEEGSKFIERLDYGMLEHHGSPADDHSPEDTRWLLRGSLRPYDPSYQPLGDYSARVPESLPMVRGGTGFELPEGIRNRYIRSKYDYDTRPAWFQGKLHNPRQWDKGRFLSQDGAWFERTRMPLFELNEEELLAITNFIEGSENLTPWGAGGDPLPAPEYIVNYNGSRNDLVYGWWTIRKYNCIACHSIGQNEGRFRRLADPSFGAFVAAHGDNLAPDGKPLATIQTLDATKNAPPVLYDAGARVRGEWLVNWLREPYEVRNLVYDAKTKIQGIDTTGFRGGMRVDLANGGLVADEADPLKPDGKLRSSTDALRTAVQMPQFYLTKSETEQIQRFLSRLAGNPVLSINLPAQSGADALDFGETIVKYADCQSCHSYNEPVAGSYAYGGSAPNMRQALTRVDREWARRWIRNPSAIQPGTAMTHFFKLDVNTGNWVIDPAKFTKPEAVAKAVADSGYTGDHVDAVVSWLWERLPRTPDAKLNEMFDKFKAGK